LGLNLKSLLALKGRIIKARGNAPSALLALKGRIIKARGNAPSATNYKQEEKK